MAELYQNPQGYVGDEQTQPITGDEQTDKYLNSLPAEERDKALKEITAPLTGEEVAKYMKEDANYKPSYDEFKAFNEYQKTHETSTIDALGMFTDAVGGIYDIAAGAVSHIFSHPIDSARTITPSLIEGGAQNIRSWYGMAAQSQDPQSILFKWKNALAKDGSIDAYKQFLEARDFNKRSVDLETGKSTIVMDKGLIDPQLTQAATIIVDPMFYGGLIAGVATGGASAEFSIMEKTAQILGMSERLAKASAMAEKAKAAIIGGTLKYGVGVPLEAIGGITRGAIDKTIEVGGNVLEGATGVTAQEFKSAAKVGGFGSIAYGVPYLSPTSKVYLGAGFARSAGEAIGAIGETIMNNGGKRGLLSFAEQAMVESDAMLAKGGTGLTPQARRLLSIIDKADPMLAYSNTAFKGGIHGAVIGGGLGYLGGGEEGLYSGAGAGFGIGSLGAIAGKAYSDVKGGTDIQRLAVQMEMLMPMMREFDPATHSAVELIRAANRAAGMPDHIVDRYIVALDKVAPKTAFRANGADAHEALLRSLGQDPKTYDGFIREPSPEGTVAYKLDADGNRIPLRDSEGFTVPTMEEFKKGAGWTMQNGTDGRIKVHINTDKFNEVGLTLPHEMFHGVFRELGMKSEFSSRLAEHILGSVNEKGEVIKPSTIGKSEARDFFRQYISLEHKNNEQARNVKLANLDKALNEYYDTGKMTVTDSNGNLVLPSLVEEFGAYYFTRFVGDKPVDYLFRGGQYTGMRGVLDSVKNSWQAYMERKVGGAGAGFSFKEGEALNPKFVDKEGKRIRVSALDYMMQDLIRTRNASSRGQAFDFRKLSPEGQEQYVRSSGNPLMYEKQSNGRYRVRTAEQVKAAETKNGLQIYKGLEAFRAKNPDALRIKDAQGNDIGGLSVDADGNYHGTVPDAVVDYLVKSGHISQSEGSRIQLLQRIARGELKTNVVEFIDYTGQTMNVGIGEDVRVHNVTGHEIPTKTRTALVIGFEAKMGKDGKYSFTAHTLDWRNIETRLNNQWKDPMVQKTWGGDKTQFTADFFSYLKNAAQPDGIRKPSATLWSEGGEYKRNVMHQVAGIAEQAIGTINKPLKPIANDVFSSYRQFRTDRMSGLRMTNEHIEFGANDSVNWVRVNMMPSEMGDEPTAGGHIYSHPTGYKFIKEQDGAIKAYKPDGTAIGKFDSMEKAVKSANAIYLKDNPSGKPVPSVDNIHNEPNDVIETRDAYTARKIDEIKNMSDSEFKKWLKDLGKTTYKENESRLSTGELVYNDLFDSTDGFKNINDKDFKKSIIDILTSFGKDSKIYEYFEEQYNKEYGISNPIFKSGLQGALDKVLSESTDKNGQIMSARLISLLSKQTSGEFGKVQTEAKAIGLIDYLQSKGQTKISSDEVRAFVQENEMRVTIDPEIDIHADFGDASSYVAEGATEGYHTFVVRVNPEYQHGVQGHFGDAVVHIRATDRTDASGKKVLFVEEIQSQNSQAEKLTESKKKELLERLKLIQPIHNYFNEYTKFVEPITLQQYEKIKNYEKFKNDFVSIVEKITQEIKKNTSSKTHILKKVNEYLDNIKNINNNTSHSIDLERNINNITFSLYSIKNDYRLQILEINNSIKQSGLADKPLQEFGETVKIASRAIMRKAVELGADRVVFVRSQDTHSAVQMRNERGQRLYDKSIPEMVNSELKKFGSRLEQANNFKGEGDVTKAILSESLGYDITPDMKKAVSRGQTFYMPSETDNIIYTGKRYIGSTRGVLWATRDFKRLEDEGGIKAYRIKPDAKILVLSKTKFDKKGNYISSDIVKSGYKELTRIASDAGMDINFWDSKSKKFNDPTLQEGDELFPHHTKEEAVLSDNEWNYFNDNSDIISSRNEIDREKLLQAVKDAGYDIIKTTTIEGEGTMVLNKNAITPLTIDDKLPVHLMPSEQESAWRNFTQERTSGESGVFQNAIGYTIVYLNKKFKVYNPNKGLIGIYNDLEEAKKRVKRDEPKAR